MDLDAAAMAMAELSQAALKLTRLQKRPSSELMNVFCDFRDKVFHPGSSSGGVSSDEGGGDMPFSWSQPYWFCDQFYNGTVQVRGGPGLLSTMSLLTRSLIWFKHQ